MLLLQLFSLEKGSALEANLPTTILPSPTLLCTTEQSPNARSALLPDQTRLQDALQVHTHVLHLLTGVQPLGSGQSYLSTSAAAHYETHREKISAPVRLENPLSKWWKSHLPTVS